ncbi:RHS repeat-associated core domain-containing protein [Flavobacterium sp.]|uniref:RHS repeat-associated core domain-containing protein n=1 Tax=Flavobacterium sp. TaxID=239 RepID=UPI0039E30E71
MDMRDYDPAIGRWLGIDPVTHHSMSPYVGMDNNPVFWADPSGADGITITLDWNLIEDNTRTNITPIYEENVPNGFPKTGPGSLHVKEKDAAIDYGTIYNSYSIINNTETFTVFYSLFLFELNSTLFSYTVPFDCGGMCSDDTAKRSIKLVPEGAEITAQGHTHIPESDVEFANRLPFGSESK